MPQKEARPDDTRHIRFSIVVPTYQRKELVLRAVSALSRQKFDAAFEVIVVVDGSTDGSADALRELDTPMPLRVLEQPNRGAAMARNYGASQARGDILLFLDDDMEADPLMLAEHERSFREGADVVLGQLSLHPDSPPNFLSAGIQAWAEERQQRLSSADAELTLHDLLTGQISVPRELFDSIGGFDPAFTHGGSFGNEDIDFGYRLLRNGYRIVFNPGAVSRQFYAVQPGDYLRRLRQTGQADAVFARKYPEQLEAIFTLNSYQRKLNRFFWRPLQRLPHLSSFLSRLLAWLTLRLLERGLENALTIRLFRETGAIMYWRGVHEKGGIPVSRSLRVLAYHSISELPPGSAIEVYGVPPEQFRQQLDELLSAGYHFVDADEFLRFLKGQGGLPRRALLLTFDDGYVDLLHEALPLLAERSIPAVVFVPSALLGGTNEWDAAIRENALSLLGVNDLHKLAQNSFEIGAHSRTHPLLTRLSDGELVAEIDGAVQELAACGLDRPRLFAYPYGEADARCHRAVEGAGIQAAFTVTPGHVLPGRDPFTLPRIEILKGETGRRLRFKIEAANSLGITAARVRALREQLVCAGKAIRLHADLSAKMRS